MSMEIREAWVQNTMAKELNFGGFDIELAVTEHVTAQELLDIISNRWLDIPVQAREKFKLRIQRLELGIESPTSPTNYDPDKLIEW